MKYRTISDADLRSIIHIEKETRTGQYITTCPWCGKSLHFYVDKKTQLFECKKCWESGSIYKLLKHLDKLYLLGDKTVEVRETMKSIRQTLEDEMQESQDELKELPIKHLPVGFKVGCNNYLKSRGLTIEDCRRYGIGETKVSFQFKNYVIIPVYDGGKVRGYLGRYANKRVPENKLRYNNSKNTEFGELLYGYDEVEKGKTETVILVEGVFDKYSVDQKLKLYDSSEVKCLATFGKKISKSQIQKLVSKEITNVIISWDYDALKEIKTYGNDLGYYFNVGVAISVKEKDLGDCNEKEVLEVFGNVKPIRQFTFDIIGKLKR